MQAIHLGESSRSYYERAAEYFRDNMKMDLGSNKLNTLKDVHVQTLEEESMNPKQVLKMFEHTSVV